MFYVFFKINGNMDQSVVSNSDNNLIWPVKPKLNFAKSFAIILYKACNISTVILEMWLNLSTMV